MSKFFPTASLALLVTAAVSPAGFAAGVDRVEYQDPSTIELLGDGFTESDLQLIANKMERSLVGSSYFSSLNKQARVVVGDIKNASSEALDTDALGDRLTVALTKSGKFEVIDASRRKAIAREYEYQSSDYVAPDGAHRKGSQAPVDYLITGRMTASSQIAQSVMVVDYHMSFVATELATGIARWAEDQHIRKRIELRGISTQTSTTLKVAGFGAAALTSLTGAGLGLFSVAHIRPESTHTEFIRDDPNDEFSDGHFEDVVDRPGSGPEPVSGLLGCGLMVAGPVIAILTYVLVPPGNPEIQD
jgi:uncharacterized protein (TIGR02722 family)